MGFQTWAILHSLANIRKCQLEDFCEKERHESCSVRTDVHSRRFPQKAEKRKVDGSDATTRFRQASCFEKTMRSVPETWVRIYDVQWASPKTRIPYDFSSYVGRTELRI